MWKEHNVCFLSYLLDPHPRLMAYVLPLQAYTGAAFDEKVSATIIDTDAVKRLATAPPPSSLTPATAPSSIPGGRNPTKVINSADIPPDVAMPVEDNGTKNAIKIAGAAVGAAGGLIVLCLLVYLLHKCLTKRKQTKAVPVRAVQPEQPRVVAAVTPAPRRAAGAPATPAGKGASVASSAADKGGGVDLSPKKKPTSSSNQDEHQPPASPRAGATWWGGQEGAAGAAAGAPAAATVPPPAPRQVRKGPVLSSETGSPACRV